MDKIRSEGAQADAAAQTGMLAGLSVHWHSQLSEIDASEWDAMVDGSPGGRPFLRHGVLSAFVDSGSACAATGWQPHFLVLRDTAGRIRAGAPAFIKAHSYGEYVFDWAWADAHDRALARHGQRYHPKLLSAIPFSPLPGERLLVSPDAHASEQAALQRQLLQAMRAEAKQKGWSSVHVLFLTEPETGLAREQGWLAREGVQFHWHNSDPPYVGFDAFLASMQRDKRKKIQQERRKVREQGVSFEVRVGPHIEPTDWDFFHRCYEQTYLERGQRPYLTRRFWALASEAAPDAWALFIATQEGERIAAALLALDPIAKVAYGRYWGALRAVSCLHFEACYYQPLQWCIEQGYERFEGGAQGEHKLTRGLLPVRTHSVHWLGHEGLREAVDDYLSREKVGLKSYISELDERSPFKPQDQGG